MIYIASLENFSNNQKGDIHLFCRVQIAVLTVNKAPISISIEYFDFIDVFCLELAIKLCEYTRINDHAIKLMDD